MADEQRVTFPGCGATVAELIDALMQFPEEARVVLQDCGGSGGVVSTVEYDPVKTFSPAGMVSIT